MNFLRWNHILCALALAINLLPAKAAQIAYSVADFSSVQGQKNWYYGNFEKGLPSEPGYTPDAFELLDRYVPNVDPNLSKWTLTPPLGESYGGYPWIRPTGSPSRRDRPRAAGGNHLECAALPKSGERPDYHRLRSA